MEIQNYSELPVNVKTEEQIIAYARQESTRYARPLHNGGYNILTNTFMLSGLHLVCTAAMSAAKGAKYGVVNPGECCFLGQFWYKVWALTREKEFGVKGVAGLRVVDASVLPRLPSAHIHVSVFFFQFISV